MWGIVWATCLILQLITVYNESALVTDNALILLFCLHMLLPCSTLFIICVCIVDCSPCVYTLHCSQVSTFYTVLCLWQWHNLYLSMCACMCYISVFLGFCWRVLYSNYELCDTKKSKYGLNFVRASVSIYYISIRVYL